MGHKKWHETQLAACKAVGSLGTDKKGSHQSMSLPPIISSPKNSYILQVRIKEAAIISLRPQIYTNIRNINQFVAFYDF